jgi:type VI secretion system protein ImpF
MGETSRSPSQQSVTLSVLDRLIDSYPSQRSIEENLHRNQSVRQFKVGVRRDLEWLLNTRRIAVEPDDSFSELNHSVYTYGLPDFMAYSLASPQDQARLLRSIQTAVERFEPRLSNVRIVPLEVEGINTKTLRFRIEGTLLMDPSPEHVSFDTVLELTRAEYAIKGDG